MTQSTTPIVAFKNVSKQFDSFVAVEKMTFAIEKGEVVGFVGANGAGKTTTISMLLGFLSPSEGQININGQQVTTRNAHSFHSAIGYAAGDMELPGHLTGKQYLEFVLYQSKGDHQTQYKNLQQRFSPELDKKIADLSRGNKQKIALVAALVVEPEMLILDEPTSGLDPRMQEVFLDTIREYQKQGGTVLMSSHYLSEITDVCSRILLIKNGRLLEDVATNDLLKMNGKTVRVVTGRDTIKPPKGAEEIQVTKEGKQTKLSFVFKGKVSDLQAWLGMVGILTDIEITEYNLEGAFRSLYETEAKERQS